MANRSCLQSRFGSTLPLLCQNNPPNCKKKLPEPPSILQLFQCQGYEKIIFTHPPAPEPRGFLICLTIFTTVLFCRGKGTGLLLQCLSYPLDFLCFSLSRALRVMLHLKKKKKEKTCSSSFEAAAPNRFSLVQHTQKSA